MKHIIKSIVYVIFILSLFACSKVKESNFYLLEYQPSVPEELKEHDQYPYFVQVKEFSINRAYDNSRIVIRSSAHKILYDRYSLWALRPQQSFADLLIQHINRLQLFTSCQKRFLHKKPDFLIQGQIKKIEKYENPDITRADLQFKIEMYDLETDEVVLCKEFTSYKKLYTSNMSYFAKSLSEQLHESNEEFILMMMDYFEDKSKD